ncbi:prepilin-type N-terminal cleavage/methylation domain-containing protein [Desulfobacula sp.]|uniref:PilW family protein n=1 Tax=Desulfobacula sp. TaxID=2593537 RepID=UPI00260B0466|nr:prepilin-type N-terminal cleavage/methylation domain-containing protein [Desulfobacula sp.]
MTLVEVMIAVMILGILMTGLTQIFGTLTRSMQFADDHSQTNGTAYFAMARMVSFVAGTDEIQMPGDDAAEHDQLIVAERILDLVDNTRAAGSDGIPDADTDGDGLVNEGGGDVKEYVSFALDKTDPDNWKLVETLPDYQTADTADTRSPQVICEHVTGFVTQQLTPGVVRIRLATGKNAMAAVLENRALARLLTP